MIAGAAGVVCRCQWPLHALGMTCRDLVTLNSQDQLTLATEADISDLWEDVPSREAADVLQLRQNGGEAAGGAQARAGCGRGVLICSRRLGGLQRCRTEGAGWRGG